jgi:RNA polymerase sigma factor (sigma-70 family)
MASGLAFGTTLRDLHDLFSGGTAVGLTDGQLLARYTASNDGTAFAALVARHGPMVAATCRAVLRHDHDVEDAFQATFLVLARKAGSVRNGNALACWLHQVARRVAIQANIEVNRRRRRESDYTPMEIPAAARPVLDVDLCSTVHEEIDRLPEHHRLPVVLCDLEGLSYEQAAMRLD